VKRECPREEGERECPRETEAGMPARQKRSRQRHGSGTARERRCPRQVRAAQTATGKDGEGQRAGRGRGGEARRRKRPREGKARRRRRASRTKEQERDNHRLGQISTAVSGKVGVSDGVIGVSIWVGADPGMPRGMDGEANGASVDSAGGGTTSGLPGCGGRLAAMRGSSSRSCGVPGPGGRRLMRAAVVPFEV
jgi:hypothetical protein